MRRAALPALLVGLLVPALSGQSPQRQVENLRAFAKAYGYVKYFHPSDEASEVDWNRFAALGAARVKDAKSGRQLRETLESLFGPLVPTGRFHGKGEPARLPSLAFSNDEVVAWQHLGVTLDSGGRENIYQSVRVNRPSRQRASPTGMVNHFLPAKGLTERRIRLSGQIRAEAGAQEGGARLWLRVDRERNQVGFFDNMDARPVRTAGWKRYEIVGDVASDATGIALGAMLIGQGSAWFDEVQLEVEKDGHWEAVPLPDPGFEQTKKGEAASGWVSHGPGYDLKVTTDHPSAGKQCLWIHRGGSGLAKPIFSPLPKPGEVVSKEIAPGLVLSYPLALPVTPAPAGTDFAALKQALAALPAPTADQEAVRLGNLVSAWNVFQHFYPYFDVVNADWDAALTEALMQGLKDTSPEDHRRTLQQLVAKLRDGHGAVYYKDPTEGDLPARLDWIEGQLVVTAIPEGSPFRRGDVILGVDGIKGQALLAEAELRVSGSDALRRHRALNIVGYGKLDAVSNVLVRRQGADLLLEVKRGKPSGSLFFKQPSEFRHEAFRDLGDGHYYINEFALEKARFMELFPTLEKAKGIIVDQRPMGWAKDPWDLMALIPHLAKEPFVSAWWNTPQVIRPDREGLTFAQSRWSPEPPKTPHLGARVLVINVPSVVSYGESILGIFEHYKLVEFVGEPTAGCNGNANFHVLPGDIRIMWTGMKVVKHDGSQHHLVGIPPTHPVKRTLKAVEEGRDEYLEKAIALLKGR